MSTALKHTFRTVSRNVLNDLISKVEPLIEKLQQANAATDMVALHREAKELIGEADKAGIVNKHLMTVNGLWMGDNANKIKGGGLKIIREERYWDVKTPRNRTYSYVNASDLLQRSILHIHSCAKKIINLAREPEMDRRANVFYSSPYGKDPRKTGWVPVELQPD